MPIYRGGLAAMIDGGGWPAHLRLVNVAKIAAVARVASGIPVMLG